MKQRRQTQTRPATHAQRFAGSTSIAPLVFTLEPRFMFDAAGVATAEDTAQQLAADASAEAAVRAALADSLHAPSFTERLHETASFRGGFDAAERAAASPNNESRREVAFIDAGVADAHDLLAALPEGTEVVLLTTGGELDQIAQWMEGKNGFDAIHIISHGSDGALQFTGGTVTADTLGDFGGALDTIRASLSEDADILLYGCDVAAGDAGRELVERLAARTGADIAASSDLTGKTTRGGDWDLEVRVGRIETQILNGDHTAFATLLGTSPTITNVHNDSIDFTQGNSAKTIDENADAAVDNADGTGWEDGQIKVSITAGATGYDSLWIKTGGMIDINAGSVSVNGTVIGLITSYGSGGTDLIIEFNADADNASVGTLLQNITYRNSSVIPGGTRTVAFTLTDADGDVSTAAETTVTLHNVNDAPVLTGAVMLRDYTEGGTAVAIGDDIDDFYDVDGDTLRAVVTVDNFHDGDVISFGSGGATVTPDGSGTFVIEGTKTQVLDALQDATYSSTSEDPTDFGAKTNRIIRFVIDDQTSTSNDQSNTITTILDIYAVNDGPSLGGGGVTPTYTEGGAAVGIGSGLTGLTDIDVPDADTTALTAVVTIANYLTGDGLAFTTTGTSINVSSPVDDGNGNLVYTLTDGTKAEILSALQSATFSSTSADPTDNGTNTSRSISFVVDDGETQSSSATSTVTVTAVESTPTLSNIAVNVDSDGETVASLLNDAGAADDENDILGMAITAVDNSQGQWKYYNTTTETWTNITLAGGQALLLGPDTKIALFDDGISGGTGTIDFKAWEYNPANDFSVVTSTAGAEFSTATTVATGSVLDAPTLGVTSIDLGNFDEDSPAATTIQDVETLRIAAIDADSTPSAGIAITAAPSSALGQWYYSLDNGSTWTAISGVSDSNALILADAEKIAFVPNADASGTPGPLTFKAWNGAGGASSGGSSDTSSNAFSTAAASVSIVIDPINDAPDVPGGATAALDTGGETVSSLLGDLSASDVEGDSMGFAITAVDNGGGQWKYYNGSAWVNITTALINGGALLLGPDTKVALFDDGTPGGSAGSLTVKAWDTTGAGTAGTAVSLGLTGLLVSSNDGTVNGNLATDMVFGETSIDLGSFAEDYSNSTAEKTVNDLLALLGALNADGSTPTGIAITSAPDVANLGNWAYKLNGTSIYRDLSAATAGAAILLSGDTHICFIADNDASGTPSQLQFKVWDGSGGHTTTRMFDTDNDGDLELDEKTVDTTTAIGISDGSASVTMTITPVNDVAEFKTTSPNDLDPVVPGVGAPTADEGRRLHGYDSGSSQDPLFKNNGGIGDVDSPDADLGIVLLGTNVSTTDGVWWIKDPATGTWSQVPADLSPSNALIVDKDSRIYFQPMAHFSGLARMAVATWDGTDGRAFNDRVNAWGNNGDANGDGTAISDFLSRDIPANGSPSGLFGNNNGARRIEALINRQPVLTVQPGSTLPAFDEDGGFGVDPTGGNATLAGQIKVSDILSNYTGASDPDTGQRLGIAITGYEDTRGTWYARTSSGNWAELSFNADGQVLHLDGDGYVYFKAADNANGTVTDALSFRAWDQTNSNISGNVVSDSLIADENNTSSQAGTTLYTNGAYSLDVQSLTLQINAVNDAPTVSVTGTPTLVTVDEEWLAAGATPSGAPGATSKTVQQLLGLGGVTFGDVDADATLNAAPSDLSTYGIAITSVDETNGTWWYHDGSTWTQLSVTAGKALLLPGDTNVTFVPDTNWNGTAEITFKVWDKTTDTAYTEINVPAGGGTTAFSSTTGTVAIAVAQVDDLPTLTTTTDQTLDDIAEDDASLAETISVASILTAAGASDIDKDATLNASPDTADLGIAISALSSGGTWKFSTDNGVSWSNIVISSGEVFLLSKDSLIAFEPTDKWFGDATLTFKGWDGHNGAGTTAGVAVTDSSVKLSTASVQLVQTVTGVNYNPTPTLTAGQTYQEGASGGALLFGNTSVLGDADMDVLDSGAGDYGGLSLTIKRDGGANAEDIFGFTFGGGSTISVNGGGDAVLDGATPIATIANGSGQIVITFSADVTTAEADEILRAITYRNTSDVPPASVDLRIDIDDGNTGAQGGTTSGTYSGTFTANITAVNDAPTFTATAGTTAFVEDGSPVTVVASTTLADLELDAATNYGGSSITILRNGGADAEDVFGFASGFTVTGNVLSTGGTNIGIVDTSTAGALTVTFDNGVAKSTVQAVLAGLTYSNSSDAPLPSVDLDLTFNDGNSGTQGTGGALSVTRTLSLSITPINDAPVITDTADITLTAIGEDDPPGGATTVSTLLNSAFTDADTGTNPGIAIVGATGNGAWEYSTDGGSTWTAVETVDGSNALLLSPTDQVRFAPDAKHGGDATLTFHAWDRSAGTTATKVDASTTGGTTAFSTLTRNLVQPVDGANDAPTLTAGTPGTYVEDGDPVAILPSGVLEDLELDLFDNYDGATMTVVRNGAAEADDIFGFAAAAGFTVTGTTLSLSGVDIATIDNTTTPGQLDITFNGNATQAVVQAVITGLTYSTDLQASPDDIDIDITFNDQNTAAAQGSGGALGFTQTVTFTITPVNDAPVITDTATITLADISEDDPPSDATVVADLLDAAYQDVDENAAGDAGIAVVEATGNGAWEYSTDGGLTWQGMGSVGPGNALLLSPTAEVRFAPDRANGGDAKLTFHAWDLSTGSEGDKVDASTTGDDTAFSTDQKTLLQPVTDVNDSLSASGKVGDATATAGSPFSMSIPSGLFSDVDQGDSVSLQVGSLPAWLHFDAATGTLTGTPGTNDVTPVPLDLQVTGTDRGGSKAFISFRLTVRPDPNAVDNTAPKDVSEPVAPPPPPPPPPLPTQPVGSATPPPIELRPIGTVKVGSSAERDPIYEAVSVAPPLAVTPVTQLSTFNGVRTGELPLTEMLKLLEKLLASSSAVSSGGAVIEFVSSTKEREEIGNAISMPIAEALADIRRSGVQDIGQAVPPEKLLARADGVPVLTDVPDGGVNHLDTSGGFTVPTEEELSEGLENWLPGIGSDAPPSTGTPAVEASDGLRFQPAEHSEPQPEVVVPPSVTVERFVPFSEQLQAAAFVFEREHDALITALSNHDSPHA